MMTVMCVGAWGGSVGVVPSLMCVCVWVCLGGFAKVKMGRHILTGEKVAIKIMNKKDLGVSQRIPLHTRVCGKSV